MTPLLLLSVPPLSVSLLFLPAGAVAVALSVAALLILAVAVPLFVAATDTTRARSSILLRAAADAAIIVSFCDFQNLQLGVFLCDRCAPSPWLRYKKWTLPIWRQ